MTKNLLQLILCLTLITFIHVQNHKHMQCTEDNYIKSNSFNDSNKMTNKQRNIISVFTKDDWNKKYQNTNFSGNIHRFFFIVIFVAIRQVIKL